MLLSATQESARTLDQAMLEAREMQRLTLTHPDLSLTDAYAIQDEGIRLRLSRGERVIGLKMGLTSKAKREQMNLNLPIYGVLTDRMQLGDGGTLSLQGSIHPKIEPEIAFILGRELRGKVTMEEALAACSGVCAALEILDSRFVGFKYFSLPDVVADNCSSSLFVLSHELHPPFGVAKLASLAMDMRINGKTAQSELSGAISGNPAQSIVELCGLLAERGLSLPAGSIVLAGAATQAVSLEPGMEIRLEVETLGAVTLTVR